MSVKRWGWLLACCAWGCKGPAPAPTVEGPAPSASVAVSAAPSAAAPANHVAGELAGKWKGSFTTKAHVFTTPEKEGASLGWKKDDGVAGAGPGEVRLQVQPTGEVSGEVSGALGKLSVTGGAEEGVLAAVFTPEADDPSTFSGTLTLTPSGKQLKGELRASTGDSLKARVAELTLDAE